MGDADTGDGADPAGDAARLGARLSLREQVARAIRSALVAGEMRPGVVYSAPGLAVRFGVSATPVREALLDLAKDGLVEPVRNKGFRVRALSAHDADEIHRLRCLLEIPTVVELARTGVADAMPMLRGLADDIVNAVKRGDVLAYVDADQRFHACLLELSGNQRLVRMVVELRSQARLYRLRAMVERGEVGPAAEEHHEILDAVEACDPAETGRLMERHLAWSRRLQPDDSADDAGESEEIPPAHP
ncbi:GntR family transcriptional regulator [Yinghuangia seranimata]|uniref:GntR family transcriptional regulator n=1 Tax=Yinghuangia seranimata TaxID=408067 RepID=UPI00248BD754|nr:GntR family transcriptional regulator [Yinghuangia seranimata]MDI2131725.1 GntR family transcriptional regulator [Yinghuangia seranimata]